MLNLSRKGFQMFEKNIELIDNISLKRRLQKISTIESKLGISYCVLLYSFNSSDVLNEYISSFVLSFISISNR